MIITYYFHCCSDTLQKHPIRNLNDYAQTTTQPSPLTTSHSLRPSRLRMPSCRKPLQPTLPTRPPAYNPRFISSKTQDFQPPKFLRAKMCLTPGSHLPSFSQQHTVSAVRQNCPSTGAPGLVVCPSCLTNTRAR